MGHSREVNFLDFSADGTVIVSGSDDNTVRLWDVEMGLCKRTLEGHDGYVWTVTFSTDGKVIASGSSDKTIKLWDVETSSCKHTLEGHRSDNPNCTCTHEDSDGCYHANPTCPVVGHSGAVRSVAFSASGSLLASGSEDNNVKIWDPVSFSCKHTLEGHREENPNCTCSHDYPYRPNPTCPVVGHSDWVLSVAFSASGSLLASGSRDHNIKIWDPVSFSCKHTLEGHRDDVRSVAFSSDGKLVASSSNDKTVRLWDPVNGSCKHTFEGHGREVISVAFSADASTIASGSRDSTIRFWDPTGSGSCQNTLQGHTSSVTKLEYVDAETLVSGSEDGTMRVWSVATGAQKEEFDGGSFAFSKDSSLEQKVGKYSITFKDNLLLISEGQSVVSFFRAPHVISSVTSAGERIGVGCKNGDVLQLRVAWLVPQ